MRLLYLIYTNCHPVDEIEVKSISLSGFTTCQMYIVELCLEVIVSHCGFNWEMLIDEK